MKSLELLSPLLHSASSGNGCSETSVWLPSGFVWVNWSEVCGLMAAAASQKMQPDEVMVMVLKMRRGLLLS